MRDSAGEIVDRQLSPAPSRAELCKEQGGATCPETPGARCKTYRFFVVIIQLLGALWEALGKIARAMRPYSFGSGCDSGFRSGAGSKPPQ